MRRPLLLLLALAAVAGGFLLPSLPASQRGSLLLPSTGAVVANGVRVSLSARVWALCVT